MVGCPRSGTTLLRTILSSHPRVAMLPFETHLLDIWDQQGLSLDDSEDFERFWSGFTQQGEFRRIVKNPQELRRELQGLAPLEPRTVLTHLMRRYANEQGKERWGEKTPDHYAHLATLFDWYPGGRALFLVRDPRAVLASWIMLDRGWTRRPADQILGRWQESVQQAQLWMMDRRVMVMRYEDLIRDPDARILAIFRFLELGTGPDRTELEEQADIARARRLVVNRDPSAWRGLISKSQLRTIESVLKREMDSFGYEPATPLTLVERGLSGTRAAARPFHRTYRSLRRAVGTALRGRGTRGWVSCW